jgi:glycosyltransferase involved in cell wall biosynthesis
MTLDAKALSPLVSVVIPAYNAGRWIGRTLRSVQAQTLKDIEIIVVDDGSTDETPSIVERAIADDPRIHLITQPNGGVARARNKGIAAARADFTAPIDADDLWHPTRLEKHLAAFERSSEQVAMVYSPCVRIDTGDRVNLRTSFEPVEGRMFFRHLNINFVGNGSGLMLRTSVARELGGYWSELRDNGAQGYEDLHFQLRLAHRYEVACVNEELIGYRSVAPGSMGERSLEMRRSHVLALRDIRKVAADAPRWAFWWPVARAVSTLAAQYAQEGNWGEATRTIANEVARNPLALPAAAAVFGGELFGALRRSLGGHPPPASKHGPDFLEFEPDMVDRRPLTPGQRLLCFVYGPLDRSWSAKIGSKPPAATSAREAASD